MAAICSETRGQKLKWKHVHDRSYYEHTLEVFVGNSRVWMWVRVRRSEAGARARATALNICKGGEGK